MSYGPWSPTIDHAERGKQLRCMAGLAAVYLGSASPIVLTLRRAESDAAALREAHAMIERMPALTRRRMLATHAAVTRGRGNDR